MLELLRALLLAVLASAAAAPAMAARQAPDFLIHGRNIDEPTMLSEHRGKVVYIDFWASWCGPCRQSFPWMNELHAKYADEGLLVVGVNLDDEREEALRFLDNIPAHFPIVFHPEDHLPEAYDVQAMPSSYVVDRRGRIIHRELGFKPGEQERLERLIGRILRRE